MVARHARNTSQISLKSFSGGSQLLPVYDHFFDTDSTSERAAATEDAAAWATKELQQNYESGSISSQTHVIHQMLQ